MPHDNTAPATKITQPIPRPCPGTCPCPCATAIFGMQSVDQARGKTATKTRKHETDRHPSLGSATKTRKHETDRHRVSDQTKSRKHETRYGWKGWPAAPER